MGGDVSLSCPTNVIAHLSQFAQVVREAASFRLSTAQRADRADHLAAPLRRSVVDSVALRGKATSTNIKDESNLDKVQREIFLAVTTEHFQETDNENNEYWAYTLQWCVASVVD